MRDKFENADIELLALDERALRNRVRPTPTDYSLRVSFWREFDDAILKSRKIKALNVYKGICSEQYWNQKFLRNANKVAWIMKPLQSYEKEIEAVLARATQRLWEVVEMDITDGKPGKQKRICPRRASVLLEAIKMVENRAKGMAVQRQMTKVETTAVKQEQPIAIVDNLDDHIKELEAEIKPEVKDPLTHDEQISSGDDSSGEDSSPSKTGT